MQNPADTRPQEDRADTGGDAPASDKAVDDKAAHQQKKREDELMDEALEETFPASDPPSAKHIT